MADVFEVHETTQVMVITVPDVSTLAIAQQSTVEIKTDPVVQLVQVAPAPAGRLLALRAVTADTTITAADELLLVDATAGTVNVQLPDPSTVPLSVFTIKKVDASDNNVIVHGLIDDSASVTLSDQYVAVTLASNGSTYWIMNIFGATGTTPSSGPGGQWDFSLPAQSGQIVTILF